MADRLISANKFAEDIYRAWELWEKKGENCFVFSDIITPILVNQPTIEAEPKHGRWIFNPKTGRYKCSACGEEDKIIPWGRPPFDYCYMCGAKMGEVEE